MDGTPGGSAASYDVRGDGLLTFAALLPTGDDFPRDFAFVNEQTLLIARQKGDVLLSRMNAHGLTTLGRSAVKGAVCVCLRARLSEN